jgi:RimJ/RimL family protein N-acetyltransferase
VFTVARLTADDLPFLLEVRNGCSDLLHDDRKFTLQECAAWFETARPDFHIVRLDGERIGYFRLSKHDPARHAIYVGADLHPRFRGRGLARPAYEAFFEILRRSYGVTTVELEVLSHNKVALALYRRLGFAETGRKEAFAIRGGASVDSIVMARRIERAPRAEGSDVLE